MELFAHLNQQGRTVVAVLHDFNQAAQYVDRIIAIRDGRVVVACTSTDVGTSARAEEVYRLPRVVIEDPVTGGPFVVPLRVPFSANDTAS